MESKVINYVGWVGHENLGDEALLNVIQSTFNCYRFTLYEGVAHSQVTFFGGGTLLPSWCSPPWDYPIRPSKFNYVFGSGVLDPAFYGQYNDIVIDRLKSFSFRFMGVRDPFSKDILKEWGINAEVIGDPCLSLKHRSKNQRRKERIAVNIGSDGFVWGKNEGRVFKEIFKVCQILSTKGYQPIIIPFSKKDYDYIKNSPFNQFAVFDNWVDMNSVLDLISTCKILIGERLHSLVFSASTFTPFVSIEYRPKCLHFAESVGLDGYSLRTDVLSSEKIISLFFDLAKNWDSMHKSLIKTVNYYRQKQVLFAKKIIEDIELLPSEKWDIPKSSMKDIIWNIDRQLNKRAPFKLWPLWNKFFFMPLSNYLT